MAGHCWIAQFPKCPVYSWNIFSTCY